MVENGNKCLEILHSSTENNNDYDLIIIDTHLRDISGFEVARKIRDKLPHKRIILTTTYSLDNISSMIDSIDVKREDVILKPFNFSELISIIEER
jgi:two-component system, OmpR family, response regulator